MSERSRLRLVVLQVLVLSLLATLLGRMWYLQVVASENYKTAAAENGTREIVTPAARGMILDSRGRPLARNRTALVVSISRTAMLRQHDGGRALVAKVAKVIGQPVQEVWDRTRLCGSDGAPPAPRCFNGSPYQPIPVTDEASTAMALQIMERREDFPGVTAELTSVREYPQPLGANAAHELGYLGPVTEAELKARAAANAQRGAKNETVLQGTDLIGRTGLEKEYDDDLRGTPGVKTLAVDHQGGVSGVLSETAPTPGNYLVTTIDAKVQAEAEKQLKAAIMRARHTGDINKGFAKLKADSGAVVVMDVRTGGIVAMASYPTYDPNIWVGGISSKDYKSIASKKNNYPNQSRAFQGEFAPASTFKAVTLPAAVKAGYSPARLLRLPVVVLHRRLPEAQLRVAGLRPDPDVPGHRGVLRHGLLQVRLRDLAARGRAAPEERREGPVHRDGQGLRAGQAHRAGPAQRVRRPDRRPGLEEGLLEGHEGLLLRQGEDRLPGRREDRPGARRVPAAAVQGELRRRLRLPRRGRGQLRDRAGRHHRRRRCRWPGSTRRSPTAAPW